MTATDTESALLAAVRANPGEDAPRLVLADWLEENAGTVACGACKGEGKIGVGNNGNPYMAKCDECNGSACVSDGRAELAEFVRVQVELAKRNPRDCNQGTCRTGGRDRPCTACREREELQARERELWPAVRGRFEGYGVEPCCQTGLMVHQPPDGEIVQRSTVLIRRGLPAVVRCTLAEWMGGEECQRCRGDGKIWAAWSVKHESAIYPGRKRVDCPTCHGTGRTPGIGPRLAQRWPVVAVEVTDKRQLGTNSTGGMRWTNEGQHSWGLPQAIFERLPTGPTCTMIRDAGENWASRISVRDYDSEPAARAALSDALIAWARGQAFRARH